MDNKPNIQTTTKLPRAKGENTLIFLKSEIANLVLSVCEAFLNSKYYIQQTDGQTVLPSIAANVVTSELGRSVTFPPIQTGAAKTSGASRVFAGAGPPTSATLTAAATAMGVAATFINALNPDLYVDTTGQAMWFCSAAGSDGASVWNKILSGGVTQYNWGAYPAGSVVQFDKLINNPGISTSGDINLPGYYVTLNGIGAATNGNAGNLGAVGAYNVPGWPKQNDWDFISFKQILKMAVCTQNPDGSVSSSNYWFNAYGPVT